MTKVNCMPFGKYKGCKIKSIPLSYLIWANNKWDFKGIGRLKAKIQEEINNKSIYNG